LATTERVIQCRKLETMCLRKGFNQWIFRTAPSAMAEQDWHHFECLASNDVPLPTGSRDGRLLEEEKSAFVVILVTNKKNTSRHSESEPK
jgi:hypothetical protein